MFGLGIRRDRDHPGPRARAASGREPPDAAKPLGKGLREFRKATEDLKEQFETEMYSDQHKPPKPTLVGPQNPSADGQSAPAMPPGGVPLVLG